MSDTENTKLPSFIKYIEDTLHKNWDRDAFTDYEGATLQYKDVARKIAKLHIIFDGIGLNKGDKVAICGRNSSNWAAAFLATVTYGAVAVPILHEFHPDQIHHIVNHSEARLLFAGDGIWPSVKADEMPGLEGVISIPDYSLLLSRNEKLTYVRENLNLLYGQKYPKFFRKEHVSYEAEDPEALALINYTSGSTGRSKGVMVPFRAITSNILFAYEVMPITPDDKVISILPMAHMYGMAFEFLYEFTVGCHVYFLTKLPSPKIIFKAFNEIKPKIVISVPLIIEKIIRKMVLPKLQTPTMKILTKVPIISQQIRQKVCQQIIEAFGGRFYEVIIGGAAFSQEIENFLYSIDFPFTVGYGTTECAPILGYADYKVFKPGSCGKAAPRMEVRILSEDPENVVGEIIARGPNVMLGYYKNPEATAETIDKDGWYHTGDLGVIDHDGNIFIKGRSRNMLLGASGQNIYPEGIEDKLSSLPYVSETVVVQRNEKLVALVYPDNDEAQKDGLDDKALLDQMEANRKELNQIVASYEQISAIELVQEEFEKTPKKSIKRYLYN